MTATMLMGVLLGGALGAACRYLVSNALVRWQPGHIPMGILLINVTGSGALGLLVGAVHTGQIGPSTLTWAGTGFLGAYTTFATLAVDSVRLLEEQGWRHAVGNLILTVTLGTGAAGAGLLLMSG